MGEATAVEGSAAKAVVEVAVAVAKVEVAKYGMKAARLASQQHLQVPLNS